MHINLISQLMFLSIFDDYIIEKGIIKLINVTVYKYFHKITMFVTMYTIPSFIYSFFNFLFFLLLLIITFSVP